MRFDGKKMADQIQEELRPRLQRATEKLGRRPKLVAIVDSGNPASGAYTNLKAKMAERLAVEFSIFNFQFSNNFQASKLLTDLNRDETVDGIMIQMPFPNPQVLINLIDPRKDVDGLREDSPFKPAVVRAVLTILNSQIPNSSNIVIVGAKGFVGGRLVKELDCDGMDKEDFDPGKIREADVVISCTGQADLIKGSMVKEDFVAIDVGYPKPEFAANALEKASFYTPVPGGVGPVTVVMLFANLIDGVK